GILDPGRRLAPRRPRALRSRGPLARDHRAAGLDPAGGGDPRARRTRLRARGSEPPDLGPALLHALVRPLRARAVAGRRRDCPGGRLMPDTIDAVFAFIFAGATVWTLVPSTEALARRIGDRAFDHPNERSLHEVPTPKLGGIAVLVAVLVGGTIFLPWDHETRAILGGAILITPVASGVTVDTFTLPFLGRVDPGSVQLLDPPGMGAIDLGQLLTVFGIVA